MSIIYSCPLVFFSCLPLNMKALSSFKMPLTIYQSVWCDIKDPPPLCICLSATYNLPLACMFIILRGLCQPWQKTKNKMGRSHEERHEKHQKRADKGHFITEQRRMDKTLSYDIPPWSIVIVIILKLTYASDLDFSSASLRFRPRFFKPRTISSSFLGREGILFSVSLTGVRLSLGR
jgi:hypothetical protein